MDLSIVIVTHNSRTPVGRCLASIERNAPSCDYETIVIDNASSDGTPAMVAETFGHVRIVANEENTGYSRGVNQGIRLSSGENILIINPDIEVQEDSIDKLIEFMGKTPDAGIAGSKLIYPDGRLQYSCRTFYTLAVLLLRRTFLGRLFPRAAALRSHLMMDYDHAESRKVDWIIGACMMVRRAALEKVGSMDERFFLYFEDIDWCYRMKNHGWSVYYVPESVMIHAYERSSARTVLAKPFLIHMISLLRYYEKWNRIFYFFRRHRGALKSIAFVASDLAAINASFLAAYFLRDLLQPLFVNRLYPLDWYFFFIIFYNLIYLLSFLFNGLYRIRRETTLTAELSLIARALFIGLAVLMASTYLTRIRIYSRMVMIGHTLIATVAAAGFRRLLRVLHRELVKARFDLKSVLIVGRREEVRPLSERLDSNPGLGINIVGHVGDDEDSLGSIEELPEIVDRFRVQEVIVLPSYHGDIGLHSFMIRSSGRMIKVRVVTPLARYFGGDVRIDELAGIHMLSIERGALFVVKRILRRAIDLVVSLILIPISALFSLLHYVYGRTSKRVRFFSETRRTVGGKTIRWRRAVDLSGREAGDLFKVSLFVQLFLGRLSLVGPPALHPRLSLDEVGSGAVGLRSGITGMWRFGGHESWQQAVENEIIDLQDWSLTKELMILARSVSFMVSGRCPEWFYSHGRDQ
jgi:GT2 family glycosyltransferase/lipopolysaccharide/colanic/teichoic acid biosynthesis glycosyltransferase